MIWGGRAPVRSALYLSTWSASKWNPVIRVSYDRPRKKGKPPKVAQVACMRKLLTILNAMVGDGRTLLLGVPGLALGMVVVVVTCADVSPVTREG